MTDEEIYDVLLRFHREVLLPDVDRILRERVEALRRDYLAFFANMNNRVDGLKKS